jgi:hypothetical protein
MTRLKRAQTAKTEAEGAAEDANMKMLAAEIAWGKAKIERTWHCDERKPRLRDLRRARNAFRTHTKAYLEADKDVERFTEDCERRQDVVRRSRELRARLAQASAAA